MYLLDTDLVSELRKVRTGKADAALRHLVGVTDPARRIPLDQLGPYLEKLDRGRSASTLVGMLKETANPRGASLRTYLLSLLVRHFGDETEVTRLIERRLEGERAEHQEMLRILRSTKPPPALVGGLVPTFVELCAKLDPTEGQGVRNYLTGHLRDPAFAGEHGK